MVSLNYRLNVFGFLGSDKLQKRNADGTTGNFGIQDQRLALAWTKAHIGAFGGDGDDITIFGESAGGSSVINHLAQKKSFPFYTKAIIESGAYWAGAHTLVAAEAKFSTVVASLQTEGSGMSDVDCLLSHNATVVALAGAGIDFGPVVDGVSLTETPWDLIALGDYNNKVGTPGAPAYPPPPRPSACISLIKRVYVPCPLVKRHGFPVFLFPSPLWRQVPVLLGSNRDEAAFFAIASKIATNLTESEMDELLVAPGFGVSIYIQPISEMEREVVKRLYDPALYEYPKDLGIYSRWWWELVKITSDTAPGFGHCGVRNVARDLVKVCVV